MRWVRRAILMTAWVLPHAALAAPSSIYLRSDQALPVAQVQLNQTAPTDEVILNANEMAMDKTNSVVIARGKVEVMQGASILTADQITYYQTSDLVIAEGNVSMLQPNGDVFFADKAELKDAMKRSVIHQFKARFADNSVMVADQAVKLNSSITTLKKASYTPCNLCAHAAPFWQMNADSAVVNDIDERVVYRNAFMEMFGYPMFYTPYLSHPTPDATAKTGLLPTSYATSPYFGVVIKAPFYWRIDQDKDVVLTPWLTANEGPLLQWDYKQLRNEGNYDVQGSITNPQRLNSAGNPIDGNALRGHIFARGMESIGDDQQVGFSIQRATDDTYLRRYGFGDQQALFSSAYYEYAQARNFGLVSGLGIQGLRSTDNSATTPLVLPIFQGYYETAPTDSGVKWSIAGDAQSLSRDQGVSQRRVSISPAATLPMVTDGGQIFTATATVRQDFYDTQDIQLTGGALHDGTTTRTLPQAALEWRYPLVNAMEQGSWVVEPIVLNVLQTNGGNPETISNEDSKLIELSDTNLFSLERVPGLDLYDSGSRVAYGFRSQYYAINGITLDGLLGQNYSFSSDTPFPNSTRAGEQFSDYIGRVAASYQPVTVSYRFAIDTKDSTLNRNEIGLAFSQPWLSFSTSYRSLKNNRYLPDSQEGVGSGTLMLDDNWSIYGNAQRDLKLNQMVSANGGILYKNECFNIVLDTTRQYARDRDVQPTTQYTFRVGFKNLGEFGGK